MWSALIAGCLLAPPTVIFDTDIGSDIDDVFALAMLHNLADEGQIKLGGVTISHGDQRAGNLVRWINEAYGRPNIPIGTAPESAPSPEFSGYMELAQHVEKPVLPARDLYARVLNRAEDNSVVIVQVGSSFNTAALLSDKKTVSLIEKKVRMLSVMGGAFTEVWGRPHREHNITTDSRSAQTLVKSWPGPILFSGFEIGLDLPIKSADVVTSFRMRDHHPVLACLNAWSAEPYERPSWDMTSVLAAVEAGSRFGRSKPGRVTVGDKGLTSFEVAASGLHRHLILKPGSKTSILSEFNRLIAP
jgi:inosine-uridine nucleoside N-ribohydrolase